MTKEIGRLGALVRAITDRNQDFLRQCSETKFLALSDTATAVEDYTTLARSILEKDTYYLPERGPCREHLRNATLALQAGGMTNSYIEALRSFKSSHLTNVLQPAVKAFLENASEEVHHIETLYEEQLKIEELLATAQFIHKLGPK